MVSSCLLCEVVSVEEAITVQKYRVLYDRTRLTVQVWLLLSATNGGSATTPTPGGGARGGEGTQGKVLAVWTSQ